MKRLYLIVGLSLFLTACGAVGAETTSAPQMVVKVGGKDSTLNVKSSFVSYREMAFAAPGKSNMSTSVHTIYLANYEMKTASPGWMRMSLNAPDQMRVSLELTGEDGTKKHSPFKVGTYGAQARNVNGLRLAKVITFSDGKQTEMEFDTMSSSKKAEGEVRITSVTADTVSGEVDLTEGDKSIKGTFTAKLPAAKK